MVLIAEVLIGAVILVLGAVLATGSARGLEDEKPDAPPLVLPQHRPLDASDLHSVRLPMAVRGYRMAEVDLLLDRLAAELPSGGPSSDIEARPAAGAVAVPAPAGPSRQLLGVALVATAATAVAWILSSAGVLPVVVAVLVSVVALLAMPVVWQAQEPEQMEQHPAVARTPAPGSDPAQRADPPHA